LTANYSQIWARKSSNLITERLRKVAFGCFLFYTAVCFKKFVIDCVIFYFLVINQII
jgi:hypothetical protein